MLHRLAWSSVPSASFQPARLGDIAARSRWNNERHHVSGLMLFTGLHFLGVLEGAERDLAMLWHNLERDERHGDLVRIGEALCGARWFPVWRVAYMDPARVGTQIETLRSPQHGRPLPWAQALHPILHSAESI